MPTFKQSLDKNGKYSDNQLQAVKNVGGWSVCGLPFECGLQNSISQAR